STYWAYTLLVDNRKKIQNALKKEKIDSCVIHPRNDIYSVFKKFKRDLPGVDYYSERELSLPCGWWVTNRDIMRIVEVIQKNL
ncbi:MAG: DegT/DnrJ/EryC1/StrS family aminotransferase, partial [bacterium]|nr:DegT/DnrJ/EryC1/StrS family aminotransferase [bacterium]